MKTPDGERLVGVRLRVPGPVRDTKPVILGFAGNAWNAQAMALYLHDLYRDHEIVTFNYRGYDQQRTTKRRGVVVRFHQYI